jgi:hypothetical protein
MTTERKIHLHTMRDALTAALQGRFLGGYLYLADPDSIALDTQVCVVDDEDDELDDAGVSVAAVVAGFQYEGLGRASIEDTAEWARQFEDPPSAELLLKSFLYYWEHDAFLPSPDAGPPPPWSETQAQLDREFYDILGEERISVRCAEPNCSRGAITLGVFCRVHHFEMIQKRPCPFVD